MQPEQIKKLRKVSMYEIRHYPTPAEYSKGLGRKLRSFSDACKLVKKLRKSGMDAFKSKMEINVFS